MHPQAQSIFEEAIGKSEQEREAFVTLACTASSELLAEVKALLQAHQKVRSFLSEPTGGGKLAAEGMADAPTLVAAVHEGPGTKIGHYKLLQQIGEGGFGVVFLAEQEQPVRRRVALKIIKLGMDTRQVIARFEAERQALALMDHPNIAKVLDAGATESGRPYFVMELVKGDPITDYCDTNNLDTEQRLDLFVQICHAVQHAHTKGIIHRDIKPSNVLVTIADGNPIPKVIDFGIAKATAARLTEKTLFTEHRALIGTPEYMSPEQAEMSGVDIDTRSDIYSLGVLLYELLTGTTPFDSEKLRSAAFGEIQRIIREQEPEKPSTRLSTMHDAIAGVAAHRRTEPARLTKLVRGDLDWIVMKALEKDRTRRYETANNLADDVRRHLSGEPVIAAPPSTAYRVKKFVRRHKVGVAAGSAIAAALVLGIVGTSMGLAWALRAERRASDSAVAAKAEAIRAEHASSAEAAQRKIAEDARVEEANARRRAETISEFVTTALQAGDAYNENGGQETTILAALENAIHDIDSGRFGDDPETEAALRNTIALILVHNGSMAEAESLATQALDARRRLHSGDHPDVAESLACLSSIQRALGKVAEAEQTCAQALEMRQRLFPNPNADVALSLNDLAALLQEQGRYADAEPLFAQALEMRRLLHKGDHVEVATCLNNLATISQYMGRLTEAESLYMQALEMWQRLFKDDSPFVAYGLFNLAGVHRDMGRLAEAEAMTAQSLEMCQRLFKGDHPLVAQNLSELANLRRDLGRPAEAEPLFVQALEMYQRLFKGDHSVVATALNNLARVRKLLGRANEAEPLYRQALEMNQRLYEGDHPSVATAMNNLAHLYWSAGRLTEAEPLMVQALEMNQRLFKTDHPNIASTLNNVAAVRMSLGRLAEAEPLFAQSLDMYRRLYKSDDPSIALGLNNLAAVRMSLGRAAEAQALCRDALAMNRRLLAAASPALSSALAEFGTAMLKVGTPAAAVEAEPVLRECLEIRRTAFPDGHPESWRRFAVLSMLGEALVGQAADPAVPLSARIDKMREAEPLLLDSYARMKDDPAVPLPAQAGGSDFKRQSLDRIIRLYESWEGLEPAKGYQEKAEHWRLQAPDPP